MSQNYYKVIDGNKYDSEMIVLADQSVAGQGDGRISLEDAKLLLAGVKDANKYTDIEKATMHYIRDHYRFTEAADKWFRTQIRSWAAIKGWAGHSADKDQVAAEAYEAEPAAVVSSPPHAGIMGKAESQEPQEESQPSPPPTFSDQEAQEAQGAPAPTQDEAAQPSGRPKWLIPLAAGGAILAVIALVVLWPLPPPTVEVPVAETLQAPAQAVAAAPALAETAESEQQAQAVETPPALVETTKVEQETQAPAATAPGAAGGTHVVEPADSLWKISAKWYDDPWLWPQIFKANQERIRNPDIIHPGAKITVPSIR